MGIGLPELLILLLLSGIPSLIAFIDIVRSEFTGYNKLVWLLAVIFFPLIGWILYFIIGRKQKIS
jgi:hypothetical protein